MIKKKKKNSETYLTIIFFLCLHHHLFSSVKRLHSEFKKTSQVKGYLVWRAERLREMLHATEQTVRQPDYSRSLSHLD